MALDECARCGKPFDRIRMPVCMECVPEEEADYARVREVLRNHKDLKADEVAEAADVTLACVMRMLNQGEIEHPESLAPVVCGRCGAPAMSRTARLCERCMLEMTREFSETIDRIRKEHKERGGRTGDFEDAHAHGVHDSVAGRQRHQKPPGRSTYGWGGRKYPG